MSKSHGMASTEPTDHMNDRDQTEPNRRTHSDGPHFLYYFYKWANKTPAFVDAPTIYDSYGRVKKIQSAYCHVFGGSADRCAWRAAVWLRMCTTKCSIVPHHNTQHSCRASIHIVIILLYSYIVGFCANWFLFLHFFCCFHLAFITIKLPILCVVMGERFVARFHLKY